MSNLAGQLTPEAAQANLQTLLQTTDSLLDQFQALHLSITALAVGGFLCALILILATREAYSWFSKADNIRRELKKLQRTSREVEIEVKAIKDLLIELQSAVRANSGMNSSGGGLNRFSASDLKMRTNLEQDATSSQSTSHSNPRPTTVPMAEPMTESSETSPAPQSSSKDSKMKSESGFKSTAKEETLDREISRNKVFQSKDSEKSPSESTQFTIHH